MSITSLLFGKRKIAEDFIFLQNRAPIRTIPLHLISVVERKITGNHIYLEAGAGKPVIFCHGLFGGIFNIDKVCKEISGEYRFIMPYLPMYDMPIMDCTVQKLGEYLETFVNDLELEEAVVIGSSMGGGAALYYACKPGNKLKGMVLCGSSGLSSIPLAKGYFKRKNPVFVKEAVQDIFFDRSIPPDEMVEDVFNIIQNNEPVIRSIRFTKSATQQRMDHKLPRIHTPALLVWGKQDPITPVEVAPKFQQLLPDASLRIINECGHVPTQEKPYQFLEYFFEFMKKINY
jgi:pimeloyl-ACP methyl ester carboxylesterase